MRENRPLSGTSPFRFYLKILTVTLWSNTRLLNTRYQPNNTKYASSTPKCAALDWLCLKWLEGLYRSIPSSQIRLLSIRLTNTRQLIFLFVLEKMRVLKPRTTWSKVPAKEVSTKNGALIVLSCVLSMSYIINCGTMHYYENFIPHIWRSSFFLPPHDLKENVNCWTWKD